MEEHEDLDECPGCGKKMCWCTDREIRKLLEKDRAEISDRAARVVMVQQRLLRVVAEMLLPEQRARFITLLQEAQRELSPSSEPPSHEGQ